MSPGPAPTRLNGMESVLELQDVTRSFHRGIVALRQVSLSVRAGEFVAVMGATGSGKSTLLHCAAGLDRPSSGSVRLAGREISRMRERPLTRWRRDRVGFVFQSYNLLSELTVRQNLALPGRLGGPRRRGIDEVLAAVGLEGTGRRGVGELSGGQRQRVAIARALVTGPSVIHAVDTDGVTVLMVTHDPVAAAWSDRLVLLRSGRVATDTATPDARAIADRLHAVSTAVAA